jgi:HEAT repeat protein/PBS lyase HEAT-like repeat-containing protein
MPRLSVPVIVFVLLLLAGFPPESAAGDEVPVPARSALPLAVKVDHHLVSVDVWDTLLADVLGAVAEQAGIRVTIDGGGKDRVTQSFTGVDLDEAILRLARGHDVVLIYGSPMSRAGMDRLVEVRVYTISTAGVPAVVDPRNERPQGARTLIRQARQQEPGELTSLTTTLASDADPVARQNAAAALGGMGGAATAALTAALEDQDPSVRTSAISSLGMVRDETLARPLASLLASDPDPEVRRASAWALGRLRSEDAQRALEAAASDLDASVQEAAVDALSQWERRARAESRPARDPAT